MKVRLLFLRGPFFQRKVIMATLTDGEWKAMLESVLLAELGDPVCVKYGTWKWPGKYSSREEGMSMTYRPEGTYGGVWMDWSAGTRSDGKHVGGSSPYSFLEHWRGFEKEQTTKYLREQGYLPESNGYVPVEVTIHNGKSHGKSHGVVPLGEAIIESPEKVQEAWDASVRYVRRENEKQCDKMLQKAWQSIADPILEQLDALCSEDPSDENYLALQTYVAGRSYAMEKLMAKGLYPTL